MHILDKRAVYENPEFQSALVRLGVWGFAVIYVSAGALSERYSVDLSNFIGLFTLYLLFFLGLLVSVMIRPVWEERRFFSLAVDVSATTFCIYLTGEAASPFFLLYIWIFVSYGTRYGRLHLNVASILSVLAYSVVLTLLGQWGEYFFEASFVLLALGVLPVYQHSLIQQIHIARRDAERSNLMVGRFLSNMTNDMRSPLVDIVATSKDLVESKLNLGQLDKVDEINSSASLLDSVIGDVLDFYKLEAGQLHIQSVPFKIHALIAEVCSATAKSALIRQIELVCSIADGVPKIIVGDEQRLKQVLTNAVRTAVKGCVGDELQISVQIDSSDHEMLLFEIKGDASASAGYVPDIADDTLPIDDAFADESEISPDLGNNLASRLISIMGGEFGYGPREEGIIIWFNLPVITSDFESDQVDRSYSLHGKKVIVFEPNGSSRLVITTCCLNQEMIVEEVDKVSDLSNAISEFREGQEIDIAIIADSPRGRDIARIADIFFSVLGHAIPLVVLAYRRNCIDLNEYRSATLIRKPFVQDQLVEAMVRIVTGVSRP